MTDQEAAGGNFWPDFDPDRLEVAAPASPAAATPWARVGRGPKRRTRWDRPPHPKDWRFYVGWLGRVLIVLGLLMFLFVAYQLWGTGIEQDRAQNQLENEFERLLDANRATTTVAPAPDPTAPAPDPTAPVPTSPASVPIGSVAPAAPAATTAPASPPAATLPPAVPVEEQGIPAPSRGDAMAYIAIPRIGVGEYVVSGVTRNDLKQGPGHFRDTPFPGQLGNSAIAGHRTTYGAPFGEIDELEPGDDIEVLLTNGYQYVYVVTGREIVTPQDYHVISNSDPARATLTLVTCDPPATSSHRLIVYAELDPTRSGPVGEPWILGQPEPPEFDEPADVATTGAPGPATTATPGTVAGTTPATTLPATNIPATSTPATSSPATAPTPSPTPAAPATTLAAPAPEADAFSEGWFSETAAWPHIGMWGAALAALVTCGWWLARFWKREWVGVLAVFVPFVVCLYFFFQNVNRLLPAGL